MKSIVAAVIVAFLSTSAMAQRRPMVERVEPSAAAVEGGTVLTISGKNLNPNTRTAGALRPQCTPCPPLPPEVRIGGKVAELVSYTDEQIVVKTPPGAGGIYDVVIGSPYYSPVVIPRALRYGWNNYDRLLVPIVANFVPGAFGSIWLSELVGRNDNDHDIFVSQFLHSNAFIPPKTTFQPSIYTNNGAAFVYHDHAAYDAYWPRPLAFSLRVRDVTRQADSWGTEVPLVRSEDAFIGRPVDLMNIPFEPETRITLRIYDLDGPTGGEVPVYIRSNDSDALLGSTVAAFDSGSYENMPLVPGLITLNVNALTGTAIAQRVRIQVGEQGQQKRLWAMASVTDNETQQVTIITPVK